MTLVVLAAGIGSRFGSLKQIEPVGLNGEIIMEYSIYDAIKAGFDEVVFIIKEENLNYFKTLEDKIKKYIKVKYAFQNNDNVPDEYEEIKNREKPLGTAHAILCAKKCINGKFMIINADDFYGRESFKLGYDYLKNNPYYGLVGYSIGNTLSANGAVKRGVCEIDDGILKTITESSVSIIDDKIVYTPLGTSDVLTADKDTIVSMNMLLFDETIFNYIEKEFKNFLELGADEFYIPEVLFKTVEDGHICKVINTPSVWHGITYKEDLKPLKDNVKKLVNQKKYPNKLWD